MALTVSVGLLSWTLPVYYNTVTNGGSTTAILGWGNWNNGPSGPGGADVSQPFFMFPRDTVRWWSIIETAPAVFAGVLAVWAYGVVDVPGWRRLDEAKRVWLPRLLTALTVVGLTSAMVTPSSIAFGSTRFNHTNYNEIPYTYQAWRNLNFHFLDYTSLMLAAGIITAGSFLFYSVGHMSYTN